MALAEVATAKTIIFTDRFPSSKNEIVYHFHDDGHTDVEFKKHDGKIIEIPVALVSGISTFNPPIGLPKNVRFIKRAGSAAATIVESEIGLIWIFENGVYSAPVTTDVDVKVWIHLGTIDVGTEAFQLMFISSGSVGTTPVEGFLFSTKDGSYVRFSDMDLDLNEYRKHPIYFENNTFFIPAFQNNVKISLSEFRDQSMTEKLQSLNIKGRRPSASLPESVRGDYRYLMYELKKKDTARLLIPNSLWDKFGPNPWAEIEREDYFERSPGAWLVAPEFSEHYYQYLPFSDSAPAWLRTLKGEFLIYHRNHGKWDEILHAKANQIPKETDVVFGDFLKTFSQNEKCQALLKRASQGVRSEN